MQAIADAKADPKTERIGMILCVLAGCVQFTKRFYHEAWKEPSTASPLVFAETVFNAPSSHIAAILPSAAINYTILGDSSAFLEGIALAAQWLEDGLVDGCVVVGAEEIDWPTLDAFKLFSARVACSEGAGAVYVSSRPSDSSVEVASITDPYIYSDRTGKVNATKSVRADLSAPSPNTILCDARAGVERYDAADTAAWGDWSGPRISPKTILGEAMMASGAWQCVAAIDAVRQGAADSALVSINGCLQQAVGACFARSK
jgi:3-oxoacyl-(acyl-carrier-protein) synthase